MLCKRCHDFNLVEWIYPSTVPNNDFKSTTFDWQATADNQRDCTFCSLVMSSLGLTDNFRSILRSGDWIFKDINLYWNRIGTVQVALDTSKCESPPLGKPGWQTRGNTLERVVGYSTINARAFQRTSQRTVHFSISLMPVNTDSKIGVERMLHYESAPRPAIDLSLICEWIVSCQTHHEGCSMPSWQDPMTTQLRMIDLQENCIVSIDRRVDYFALSYCWGSATRIRPQPLLKSTTKSIFERKGILTDVLTKLPQTIQDAMQLSRNLNCRYLWIDALCICQDDAADKSTQIQHMDQIYSHATLTIVAAAGGDAWSGLPGLRDGTRAVKSIIQQVDDITLLARWPRPYFPSSIPPSWEWSERAWTLQEQVLSKRLLIFTEEEIMWHCRSELLSEGIHRYSTSCCPHAKVDVVSNKLIGMRPDPDSSPLQLYRFYMAGASTRKIGYEEDRLNCVTGLFNTLRVHFPHGFLWGLPIAIFDCAMLFHCGVWDEAPFERREMFPSWSWVGQCSHARLSGAGPCDAGYMWARGNRHSDITERDPQVSWIQKEVAIHYISNNNSQWTKVRSEHIRDDKSVFYGASQEIWRTNNPQQLLVDALARLQAGGVSPAMALAGYFQVAKLKVSRVKSEKRDFGAGNYGSGMGYAAYTPSGRYICAVTLTEAYRLSQPDNLTFVLVAQQNRWADQLGPLFELLLVEQKQGLTTRLQIGRDTMLTLDKWEEAGARWEFLVII